MNGFEGLDEELENSDNKVTPIAEVKPKRRPFQYWTVNGQEHKMKLTTQMIGMLEKKYRTNILNLISSDGLPPLSVMLTIIQASMSPWEHNTDSTAVLKLYESWCEEGGNQIDLLSQVVMPTLVVSGFFTEKQGNSIMEDLKNTDELL